MAFEDGKKLKIFTGNANPALAKEICDYLGLPLGEAFVGRFNNGEVQIMIDESVRGKDVFIIQPTSYPVNDNLMELLYLYKKSDDEVFPTLDNEIKYSVINHTICS